MGELTPEDKGILVGCGIFALIIIVAIACVTYLIASGHGMDLSNFLSH